MLGFKLSQRAKALSISLASTTATLLIASPATAQDRTTFSETIVITGKGEAPGGASFETRHALDADAVSLLDAGSADEILRYMPGAYVPTNSRGEAIAFVRNASERQVAVFYEGADINIPWDNRLDLSLIPAGLIGTARLAAGPLAPHYGVNALGAISLSPISALRGTVAYGSEDRFDANLAVPLGPVLIGGSYTRRDGDSLSSDAKLPFSQPGRDLRTNTDRELASVFGRVNGEVGAQTLSLTAFHVWGEKGIAPESNRASGARFWRYPSIQHSLIVGNARSELGASTELDSTVWYQRFGQTIDNYADVKYDRVTARQIDRDHTVGLRELLKHRSGPATFVGSFNFLQSTHRQRDISYANGIPPAVLPNAMLYRQRNWSVGGELEYDFSPSLRSEIGVGYDVVNYVRTADKPAVKDAGDWTGRAALVFEAGDGWRIRGGVGRKMRAPTMRERFGEGIKRFMPNPDLKPERVVTAEIGAEWQGANGAFYAIPFMQDLDGTIDQRNVGSLRQRINLKGSTVKGLNVGGSWRPAERLTLSGNAVWTQVRRKAAPAGELNRIAEKPALVANLAAKYAHPTGFSTMIEAQHVGRAYSADTSGALVPLERSTAFNWRAGYGFEAQKQRFELFLHVDNIGDTFIEPQLGLPAPGRSVRVGLKLS